MTSPYIHQLQKSLYNIIFDGGQHTHKNKKTRKRRHIHRKKQNSNQTFKTINCSPSALRTTFSCYSPHELYQLRDAWNVQFPKKKKYARTMFVIFGINLKSITNIYVIKNRVGCTIFTSTIN